MCEASRRIFSTTKQCLRVKKRRSQQLVQYICRLPFATISGQADMMVHADGTLTFQAVWCMWTQIGIESGAHIKEASFVATDNMLRVLMFLFSSEQRHLRPAGCELVSEVHLSCPASAHKETCCLRGITVIDIDGFLPMLCMFADIMRS